MDKFNSLNWFESMISKLDNDQSQADLREKKMAEQPDMNMGQNQDY